MSVSHCVYWILLRITATCNIASYPTRQALLLLLTASYFPCLSFLRTTAFCIHHALPTHSLRQSRFALTNAPVSHPSVALFSVSACRPSIPSGYVQHTHCHSLRSFCPSVSLSVSLSVLSSTPLFTVNLCTLRFQYSLLSSRWREIPLVRPLSAYPSCYEWEMRAKQQLPLRSRVRAGQ